MTDESEPDALEPSYAMVEIFGHRQHYGEIRDVEIAGGKLLEVRDIDSQKVHLYGAAAIFSLTPMTAAEMAAHVADMKRRREEQERWRAEREARRLLPAQRDEFDDESPLYCPVTGDRCRNESCSLNHNCIAAE